MDNGLTPGCTPDNHRFQFVSITEGQTHYVCMVCGEQLDEYIENHGC